MRHPILASLLVVIGLFSIGMGVHQMHDHCSRRRAFEQHVADVCVQAAQRTLASAANSNTKP